MTFDLKARLEAMGLHPKKAFGQNFLVNPQVIGKIIRAVQDTPHTDLMEIGPGLGALTEPLLKAGLKPRLIELDEDLVRHWRDQGYEVLFEDALRVNWNSLGLRSGSMLVSNLPYQISSSLVIDRCAGPEELQHMVLMFQKEVAQRLMAEPRTKEYGLLSVMAQLHFKMRKVSDCAPGDFFPPPKVASRVLAFERINGVTLGPKFLSFLKQAFGFRRKFLLKNLRAVVDKSQLERLPEIMARCGLSAQVRAEELTPAQFVTLFHELKRDRE